MFIDRGACPFECCTYREWTVEADTRLYDRPDGKMLAKALHRGQRVTALTGEVHVKPLRVTVLRDQDPYKRGETFYLLTYLGEGVFRVWYKGQTTEEYNFDQQYQSTCAYSKDGCWARPEGKYESTWWVKVRAGSGLEGWSNQPDHFGNKDACG